MILESGRPTEGSAVHEDRIMGARLRKRVGHVALFVALAVVPVLALNSLATADTGTDPTASPTAGPTTGVRAGLTDTQSQCLADQGVTLPTRSADGGKPALTREQRQELRAAGQSCGLRGLGMSRGPGHRLKAGALTDAQRQCLVDQGVSPPDPSNAEPRDTSRDTLRQAAQACGLPARGHHGGDGTI
jgi:hypothetical protein